MAKQQNARELQRERHHELIRKCLGAAAGQIDFSDVADLYRRWFPPSHKHNDSSRRKQYRNDCKTLVSHFAEMSESYLSPFFLPVPAVQYDGDSERLAIVSGRRPIAVSKNKNRQEIPDRRALARFVATATWPDSYSGLRGKPLFPPNGRVYAGHGRTVCIFFHEYLCEERKKWPNLTVYTASLEIAGLLYYLHQEAGTDIGGIRFGAQLVVDREMGAIRVDQSNGLGRIDVAMLSCNGVYGKAIYSDADPLTHEFARQFLDAAERIVLVVEHWKFGRTEGNAIQLPGAGTKPILIVTDAPEETVLEHKPEGVGHLIANLAPITHPTS